MIVQCKRSIDVTNADFINSKSRFEILNQDYQKIIDVTDIITQYSTTNPKTFKQKFINPFHESDSDLSKHGQDNEPEPASKNKTENRLKAKREEEIRMSSGQIQAVQIINQKDIINDNSKRIKNFEAKAMEIRDIGGKIHDGIFNDEEKVNNLVKQYEEQDMNLGHGNEELERLNQLRIRRTRITCLLCLLSVIAIVVIVVFGLAVFHKIKL